MQHSQQSVDETDFDPIKTHSYFRNLNYYYYCCC